MSIVSRQTEFIKWSCIFFVGAAETAQEAIANIRTMRSYAGERLELMKYEETSGNPDALKETGDCCWYIGLIW